MKYYHDNDKIIFNHLHTDHYAVFLYFLSNNLCTRSNIELASKAYALNKALNGVDIFYEVKMPDIFVLQHPVGTFIGRGHLSKFLAVYQRCTIGANLDNQYPRIGEGVVLFGGASLVGDCHIGDHTWFSVGTTVVNSSIPANSIVFGKSPHLTMKPATKQVIKQFFHV
jgi:serine O-acetyltransferase